MKIVAVAPCGVDKIPELLCSYLSDVGLADFHRFFSFLAHVHWTKVLLLQSHRVGNKELCFFGRCGPNGDLFWFNPVKAAQVTVKVARLGRKCPARPTAGQDQ